MMASTASSSSSAAAITYALSVASSGNSSGAPSPTAVSERDRDVTATNGEPRVHPIKRTLLFGDETSESPKKRRKQSTPVKIPTDGSTLTTTTTTTGSTKPPAPPPSPSPSDASVAPAVWPSGETASCQLPGLSFAAFTNQVSPFSLLDMGQTPLLARPLGQPRIRIFNPDAYCDLCNKEFCNKYFLKTHKANKHGIYTDLPTVEFNLPKPDQHHHLASPPTSASGTLLLTAACDICQKRFCNRNFVKRHKAKVHGIPMEAADIDPENTDNNSNLEPTSDSNSETPTLQPVNASPCFYPDNLQECLKPFLDTNDLEPPELNRWPPTTTTAMTTTTTGSSSGSTRTEAIHRPRGLGIVNPEAFCEICCKEYCNKYFLRTHKLKRHGIAIPDDPPGKEEEAAAENVQTSPLNLIKAEQQQVVVVVEEKKDDVVIMCTICGVHVAQRYMKAHYEACHLVGGKAAGEIPVTSTASSPTSTSRLVEESTALNVVEASYNNDRADDINDDLKKLQTMILQLNNLNVCQIVTCNVCCKEFENKFYLQAHMMSDHGQLYMKITDEKISINPGTISTNSNESSKSMPLEIKLEEPTPSLPPPPAPAAPVVVQPPAAVSVPVSIPPAAASNTTTTTPTTTSERRTSISMAPTNSYCEICNKELCNKYFMKTHMQRMHGIEIENGAQIGGVVCNICNKELCSKYFLRVHKHNTHGIVEDGMPLSQSRQSQPDELSVSLPATSTTAPPLVDAIPTTAASITTPPFPSDASLKPNEMTDLNHRYFVHFTEVCPICSRRFRSTKWLKAHLVTDHGKAEHDKWEELEMLYQKQKDNSQSNGDETTGIQNLLSNIFGQDELKKYYCMYCSFSTPVLAFLFVHERSHNQQLAPPKCDDRPALYQCPICTQSYQMAEMLQKHILLQHAGGGGVGVGGVGAPASKVEEDTNGNDAPTRHLDLASLAQNLAEVSAQSRLPSIYALPSVEEEETDGDERKYTMQPFLVEECSKGGGEVGLRLRLVPCLVFLPVREKVTTPLTTQIKLTPT